MKRNHNSARFAVLFAVTACCGLLLGQSLRAQTIVDEITQQPVFQQRILYVGDRFPNDQDTRELGLAIQVMYADGPQTGIDAMEDFIARNPDSAWTPSLRGNL